MKGFLSFLPNFAEQGMGLMGSKDAHVAQLAEHILGKDEVTGSNPVMGSRFGASSAECNRKNINN